MLKYIIAFCSFIIAYAVLSFAYAIKECCFNSNKQTKEQVEEFEEVEEFETTESNLKQRKFNSNGVAVRPCYHIRKPRLGMRRSIYMDMKHIGQSEIDFGRLTVYQIRKKEIENLLNELAKKEALIKELSSNTVKAAPKDNLNDILKNDININTHGNQD